MMILFLDLELQNMKLQTSICQINLLSLSFTKEIRSRIHESKEVEPEQETKVPLTYEKLEVFEELQQSQDIITKEPIKETKTVHIPLTCEDIAIETRPPSIDTQTQTPITSRENITIPVKKRRR
jgi:stress response protein YsnF